MSRRVVLEPLRAAVAAVAVSAIVAAGTGVAGADGGAKNVVLAFNTTDGATLPRSAVQVVPATGESVEPENLATARASCTDCRTVAVAVQAVMVTSDADVVSPRNAAVAVNSGCTRCQTFAAAYQYVVTTSRAVSISPHGRRRIGELRSAIAATTASNLAFPELEARLDQLTAELWSVIDREIAAAGATRTGTPRETAAAA